MNTPRKTSVRIGKAGWAEHIAQWQASGLTQAAYCREKGLNQRYFSVWKKKLNSPSMKSPTDNEAPSFVSVEVMPNLDDQPIALTLPNGIAISIPTSLSQERIQQALQMVVRLTC